MSTDYQILSVCEARARGLAWPGSDYVSDDEYGYQVWRFHDGQPVELLGEDGGEPEDQTLTRDWAWVATALQDAYQLGVLEAGDPDVCGYPLNEWDRCTRPAGHEGECA